MDGTMVQENRERVNLKMGKMFKTVQWYDTGVKVQPFPLSFKSQHCGVSVRHQKWSDVCFYSVLAQDSMDL